MILEGFEIDNWSCIQHVAVGDLPQIGVVVLHGPNGTGKSSIVEALRACLMDNKSTSKALERGFPKNSSEKPRVSVTFRVAGTTWRITKHFGTKESKLESRTLTGQWKLETADPSEAHERTRQLTGGSDSTQGLHQLLWLTQAEFRLPEPKKFDADVQSQLRDVLGVLQTPLDDRFLCRVKEEWSRWFGGRGKPGDKPKLKKDCPLDKARAELNRQRSELDKIEAESQAYERMMEKSQDLEVLARDFRRQWKDKTAERDSLQLEYENSLKRIEAHQLANERLAMATKALEDAEARRQRRADCEQRIHLAEMSAITAGLDAEEKVRRLEAAEQRLRTLRREHQALANQGRGLQNRLNQVSDQRRLLTDIDKLKNARENLARAEAMLGELEGLKEQARACPAPDDATIKKLEENRAKASQARASLEAAAIALTLIPEPGAVPPRLTIDGAPVENAAIMKADTSIECLVRRRAEITIPGWGRAEVARGSDARNLDQIESDLNDWDRKFVETLAPFGIIADDPTALDQLRNLAAASKLREPELKRKQEEMSRLAPRGLDPRREEVARLEKLLLANQVPPDATELERLDCQIKGEMAAIEKDFAGVQGEIEQLEKATDGAAEASAIVGNGHARADKNTIGSSGLRREAGDARERQATLNATVELHRGELERMLTSAQIEDGIRAAEQAVDKAHAEVLAAQLSDSETTVRQRLDAANDGWQAIQKHLATTEREFHQIEGALRQTEGMHQKRAAAAARVEELTRLVDRDALESETFDRLYALFEECREKQLGSVMGPIHDRVLRWMRLLRIGGYQSIRFNDQFLPDKLIADGGAIELAVGEESTGTIEQIALMVRLALGSTLSTPDEPVAAILDDPLTHSDVVRLDRMRAVLKDAAAGDPSSAPPAGPLQIVVLTCHPEWFALDGAKIIDLAAMKRVDVY